MEDDDTVTVCSPYPAPAPAMAPPSNNHITGNLPAPKPKAEDICWGPRCREVQHKFSNSQFDKFLLDNVTLDQDTACIIARKNEFNSLYEQFRSQTIPLRKFWQRYFVHGDDGNKREQFKEMSTGDVMQVIVAKFYRLLENQNATESIPTSVACPSESERENMQNRPIKRNLFATPTMPTRPFATPTTPTEANSDNNPVNVTLNDESSVSTSKFTCCCVYCCCCAAVFCVSCCDYLCFHVKQHDDQQQRPTTKTKTRR